MEDAIIYIANGITCTAKNVIAMTVRDALEYVKTHTKCYEYLKEKVPNRVYLDIEGKLVEDMTEEQFNEIDERVKQRIIENSGDEKIALATSSSFRIKKISWHCHYPNLHTDRPTNKQYAQRMQKAFDDICPQVKVDLSPYMRTQKFRMLNSVKEGDEHDEPEPRPLRLILGDPVDTLIGYIPPGTRPLELPNLKEEAKKRKEEVKQKKEQEKEKQQRIEDVRKEHSTLFSYLDLLTPQRIDDYASWITLGLILFQRDIPLEIWEQLSRKGDKFKEGECEDKWKTFKKRGEGEEIAGLNTLLKWIEEDTPDAFGKTYAGMKKEFEKTHFKVMFPFQYVEILPDNPSHTRPYLYMGAPLDSMHRNMKTSDGKQFVPQWMSDETMRTYRQIDFYPNTEECPEDVFNSWDGFVVDKMKITEPVSLDRIYQQMRYLVAGDEEGFIWLKKYIAHMFQRPWMKSRVGVIFAGGQGTGKDTFWDFVGSLMGHRLYFTTDRPDDDLYGRFSLRSACKILIKTTEMSNACFKRNADRVKSKITEGTLNYEEKGQPGIVLNSFENHIYTTNDTDPIYLEQGERRMVIFKPENPHAKERSYFDALIKDYNNESVKRAFYEDMMKVELGDWLPQDRVMNAAYKEAELQSSPIIAKFLYNLLMTSFTDYEFAATALLDNLNEKHNTNYSLIHLGRMLSDFVKKGAIVGRRNHHHTQKYFIDAEKTKAYLVSKNWWYELPE